MGCFWLLRLDTVGLGVTGLLGLQYRACSAYQACRAFNRASSGFHRASKGFGGFEPSYPWLGNLGGALGCGGAQEAIKDPPLTCLGIADAKAPGLAGV